MPNFDTNDPASLGWSLGTGRVTPFRYQGHDFPGGVDERLVAVFTLALDRICRQPGFSLHTGAGLGDGDWGYENRNVTNGQSKSFHAYGNALDLNAPWNPYGSATPPATPWRMPMNTSDLVEPLGLLWGGGPRWGTHRDWMHLENHNTPAEAAAYGAAPPPPPPASARPAFPLPAGHYFGGRGTGPGAFTGFDPGDQVYDPALRSVQLRLGVTADGLYGPLTTQAAKQFQMTHGLSADGLIGPLSWRALFS